MKPSHEPEFDRNAFENAWRERDEQLSRHFGPMEANVISSTPGWAFGEAPTVNIYRGVPGRVVFCTSEMTGGRDSLNIELAIMVRSSSPLADGRVPHGGRLLAEVGKLCHSHDFEHLHTLGPLHEEWHPLTRVLFLRSDFRFWMGKKQCSVMLCIGINDAEFALKQQQSPEHFEALFRAQEWFPFTDPSRKSIA